MSTFIMLTRLAPEALNGTLAMEALESRLKSHVAADCPEVAWLHSYVTTGPFDYLDIFSAPDLETAIRVSALVRCYGRAWSEIWGATEWANFKEMLHRLPERG